MRSSGNNRRQRLPERWQKRRKKKEVKVLQVKVEKMVLRLLPKRMKTQRKMRKERRAKHQWKRKRKQQWPLLDGLGVLKAQQVDGWQNRSERTKSTTSASTSFLAGLCRCRVLHACVVGS
mmetsp:Transcript_5132/g.12300  ORF Transcript_5132/g.12300 Transcript_5132/m.12300 type:complete len:120 (+) Transcript_5132:1485-1844(+)